ncbi:hypothetical protein ROZALSC1DRAFT_21002 [Rozella allomycis CSF55]|nr:hypothetical protein ROZALSC1DRAFT_21002 [Rozella allomycis CSF55]
MFPDGNMQILQIQIPETKDFDLLTKLGQSLEPLLNDNYALVCSGSVTHNLSKAFKDMGHLKVDSPPAPYAMKFKDELFELLTKSVRLNGKKFMDAAMGIETFFEAHPTLDHFLPLLIFNGASSQSHGVIHKENDVWSFSHLSMCCFKSQ